MTKLLGVLGLVLAFAVPAWSAELYAFGSLAVDYVIDTYTIIYLDSEFSLAGCF